MSLDLHISDIFCKFVGKDSRFQRLEDRGIQQQKQQDNGDIYVLFYVVIRHLPCHLHSSGSRYKGNSEDTVNNCAWNIALTQKAITRMVQWLS